MAPASETPLAVEASGLCRRYGRRWALVDVGLRVAPGRAVMLAGRNGSGKSTLLRLLATAIRPDRGSARVDGHDVAHEAHRPRRVVRDLEVEALAGHHGRALDGVLNNNVLALGESSAPSQGAEGDGGTKKTLFEAAFAAPAPKVHRSYRTYRSMGRFKPHHLRP